MKKYIKVELKEVDDLPEAGLYFCAITDDCYGSFHHSPDDKDSVDFWISNVMWYLIEEPEDALKDELLAFNSWMCGKQYDGRIPMIETCINEYLKSK